METCQWAVCVCSLPQKPWNKYKIEYYSYMHISETVLVIILRLILQLCVICSYANVTLCISLVSNLVQLDETFIIFTNENKDSHEEKLT